MYNIESLKLGIDGFQPTDEILLKEIKNSTHGIRYEYVHKNEHVLISFFDHVADTLRAEKWIVVRVNLATIDKTLNDQDFYRFIAQKFSDEMTRAGFAVTDPSNSADFDLFSAINNMSDIVQGTGAKLLLILEHFQLIHNLISSESQLIELRDLPCLICYVSNITILDIETQLYPEVYSGNSNLHGTITKSYVPWDFEDYFEDVQSAINNTEV